MSDYQYDNDAEAWEAAFESDPVGTSAYLAQQYAAQYAQPVDPNVIAAQAAAQVAQIQAGQQMNEVAATFEQKLDRHMSAAVGVEDHERYGHLVRGLLAQDGSRAQLIADAAVRGDYKTVTEEVAPLYAQVKKTHSPEAREWAKIKQAGAGDLKNYNWNTVVGDVLFPS